GRVARCPHAVSGYTATVLGNARRRKALANVDRRDVAKVLVGALCALGCRSADRSERSPSTSTSRPYTGSASSAEGSDPEAVGGVGDEGGEASRARLFLLRAH